MNKYYNLILIKIENDIYFFFKQNLRNRSSGIFFFMVVLEEGQMVWDCGQMDLGRGYIYSYC